jgi:hypothetical protein
MKFCMTVGVHKVVDRERDEVVAVTICANLSKSFIVG